MAKAGVCSAILSSTSATTWRTTSCTRWTGSAWRIRWKCGLHFSILASSILPLACPNNFKLRGIEVEVRAAPTDAGQVAARCAAAAQDRLRYSDPRLVSRRPAAAAFGDALAGCGNSEQTVPLACREALVNEHLERRANLGYHLWGLMVLFIWMKRWNIEMALEEAATANAFVEVLDEVGSLSPQLASSSS